MLEQFVVSLIPTLLWHTDLPQIRLVNFIAEMTLQLLLEIQMLRTASAYQQLLQNSHDVPIVEGLSSQGINDCRDVHLSCRKQCRHLELNDFTARLCLQKVNVRAVRHLSEDFQIWIALLNRLVNENRLSIQHLVSDFRTRAGGRIVTEDDSFISLVDLSLSEYF